MDFGPFILFTLVLIAFLVYGADVLWRIAHKDKTWKRRLCPLWAMAAFLIASGLFIYKVFFLDEALAGAAMNGDTATVRTLLARGADPNATFNGDTALHWAEWYNQKQTAALLRKARAHE